MRSISEKKGGAPYSPFRFLKIALRCHVGFSWSRSAEHERACGVFSAHDSLVEATVLLPCSHPNTHLTRLNEHRDKLDMKAGPSLQLISSRSRPLHIGHLRSHYSQ